MHLSRSTPPPLVKEAFVLFDDRAQQCFSECTAVDASQQAQLSLKRGGLGLWCLSCHSPAAYIASFQSSSLFPSTGKYLFSSVDLYNSLVYPQDALTPESVGNSHLSQKVLSSKIEDRQFSNLHSATLITGLVFCPSLPPIPLPGCPSLPPLDSTSTWSLQNLKWH